MSLDLFIDHMQYVIGLAVCLHLRTKKRKKLKQISKEKIKMMYF